MSKNIEYVPVRQPRLGIAGRFGIVLAGFSALCLFMGFRLIEATTIEHESFALVWFFFAACFGGIAVLIALGCWIAAGRR